ncbi:tetratricopeptide repeat protein [Dokdonella fugitiva]|jgi:tetratricopeptide (TPR) repeat protein|nr:tetratricopeptide repeat protein [Dokdonella fugitiva]
MSLRSLAPLALAVALAFGATHLHAEALVRPVPTPDLTKLPPDRADELRKTREAFEKSKIALVGDPLAEAYAILGAAYARNGFIEAATIALEDASLLAPRDGRWIYAQGVLARAQKQAAVAQNYFDIALQLNQDYLPIRVTVARSKMDNGDFDGARKLLSDYVARHTDQAMPYAMLGEIALKQKRYAEAIEQTQRALAIEPKANALYATLAEAQAGAGNAQAAAEARAKAGNVAPLLVDPLGDGLLGRPAAATTAGAAAPSGGIGDVPSLLALHQYDAARKLLDTALAANPKDPALLALYARAEAAAGNLAAANTRADAAIAADRNSALAQLSKGVAQEMGNDDAGAQRSYQEAVRLDPKLGEARSLLAALLLRTGRAADAATQYRALVQLDLRDAEHWMQMVAADVVAGQCGSALRDASDLLATDINNKFVLQLFVRIASTCPQANANERRGALEYGRKLYGENPSAPNGEAYALALAANGKWDDAVKIQQAAMFVLVRNGLKAALTPYRQVLQQLQAHKLPDRPWPADAAVYHPLRLAPYKPPAKAAG